MTLSRRKLITGLGASFLAAPAIVRASSLMAISPVPGALYTGDPIVKVYAYQIVNVELWSNYIRQVEQEERIAVEHVWAGDILVQKSDGTVAPWRDHRHEQTIGFAIRTKKVSA